VRILFALAGTTSPFVPQGTPPWQGGEFLIVAGLSGFNVNGADSSASPFLIVIVIVSLSTILELTVASEERCGSVDYDYE